ncbi:hypothetical protein [Vibrio profundi]|uniref:tetratricopeptide repeat protein n=1 Tax=Vibrio profundi TaxID=1774960 RepID=UPI00373661D9
MRNLRLSQRVRQCCLGALLAATSLLVNATSPQPSSTELSVVEQQESLLAEYSQNESLDLDQRVAATSNLGMYYGANAIIAVARASRSRHVEMRLASIRAAEQWEGRAKWDVIEPLLSDSDTRVKDQAVQALVIVWPILSESHQAHLDPFVAEYLGRLPNTVEGDIKKAWFYRIQKKHDLVERQYEQMSAQHKNPQISIIYAGYLRDKGKEEQSLSVLESASIEFSNNATIRYSLGLSYHRLGELNKSKQALAKAVELEPSNAKYTYVYATTLREWSALKAAPLFEKAYQLKPEPAYLYAMCDALLASKQSADQCLDELTKVAPEKVVDELRKAY